MDYIEDLNYATNILLLKIKEPPILIPSMICILIFLIFELYVSNTWIFRQRISDLVMTQIDTERVISSIQYRGCVTMAVLPNLLSLLSVCRECISSTTRVMVVWSYLSYCIARALCNDMFYVLSTKYGHNSSFCYFISDVGIYRRGRRSIMAGEMRAVMEGQPSTRHQGVRRGARFWMPSSHRLWMSY